MTISNYTQLKNEALAWSHRADTDTSDRLGDFVKMAESTLNHELRLDSMKTQATLSLSSGNDYVALPDRTIEIVSLVYSNGDQLELWPQRDIDEAYANSASGKPRYYAVSNDQFLFDRDSDADYSLLLHYFKGFDIESDTTNWLLTNRPNAYLYGTLSHLFLWVQDRDSFQQYDTLFRREIDDLKYANQRKRGLIRMRVDPSLVGRGVFDINTGV